MSGGIGYVLGSFAVPVISVICGLILWKATPPINAFFGYRSKISRRNELAWSFAQKTAGRLLVMVCAPTALMSMSVGIIADKNFSTDGKFWALMVLVAFQTAVMALINLQTERKMSSAFDENGEPRE